MHYSQVQLATTEAEKPTPIAKAVPQEAPPTQQPENLDLPADDQVPIETPSFDYTKYMISLFARNFYNFKLSALCMAFIINFFLLFYRVSKLS